MTIQVTTGKPEAGSKPDNSEPVTGGPKKLNPLLNKSNVKNNAPAEISANDENKIREALKKNENKTKFSVDYSIPTLEEIALPGNAPSKSNQESSAGQAKNNATPTPTPTPNDLLNTLKALNTGLADKAEKNNGSLEISPEIVDKLAAELQATLIPEIEKSINFAFNNALATAMDQASRTTRTTISKRIRDLLPELLRRHLEDISKKS